MPKLLSHVRSLGLAALLLLCLHGSLNASSQWTPIGPDGGDVRSLSFDPQHPDHILLGTSSGDLFVTTNAGASWSRLAHLGAGDDLVLDHIVFSPADKSIFVAAWSIEDNARGDLFRSRDNGQTWEALPGLHNKSIRSFVMSPSNPRLLIAGALDGVFRSSDSGMSWQRISPEGHAEIHNIESLAIDPRNPEIIYAGTWHLPWKTEDGGRTWHSMKQGIIDDSDVFSIIVDHANPSTVYLSACSGIYKSDDAGAQFHKVQGIPFSARRTRMLHQDPLEPGVVYAGTTEGLWRTTDAGASWKRVTAANVIVNDISVDPRDSARIMLGTDRSGVLVSQNSATTFTASNQGFVHRQVTALVRDPKDPSTLYAGLVNDKEFGGVFATHDGGQHWEQRSAGLGSRDVFVLSQAANGDVLAGTNSGIFELARGSAEWRPINEIVNEKRILVKGARGKAAARTARVEVTRGRISGRVNQIQVDGHHWYAATSQGLFVSDNDGRSWHGGPVLHNSYLVAVCPAGKTVAAASINRVMVSTDGGAEWREASLQLTAVHGITIVPSGDIWVASREGAYRSSDGGSHWQHVLNGLAPNNLVSVVADEDGRRMIATTGSDSIYESLDSGTSWHTSNAGFAVRSIISAGGRLFGATAFDGIIAQPLTDAATRRSQRMPGSPE